MPKIYAILALLIAFPAQAEEVDLFPKGLLLYTATLAGGAVIPESDKQSHYYFGLIGGTWGTIFTKNPWIGTATGCIMGAGKEAYDRNNHGVADWEDFYYTCAASAISAYSTGQIIMYYKDRPMVGIQKRF